MVKLPHFEPEIKKNTIWFFRQKNSSVLEPCVSPWPYLIFTCSAVILWKLYLSISWVSKDFLSFRIFSQNFRVFPIISVFQNFLVIFCIFYFAKIKAKFHEKKKTFAFFASKKNAKNAKFSRNDFSFSLQSMVQSFYAVLVY